MRTIIADEPDVQKIVLSSVPEGEREFDPLPLLGRFGDLLAKLVPRWRSPSLNVSPYEVCRDRIREHEVVFINEG